MHAFMPKTELKEQFPSIQNNWHAHGVMRELVVDNGQEFHSTSLENACFSLGIEIHYSARKTPWYKGKIERFLGTLNRAIAHGAPGTTFSNIFEKEDYNPEKFAIVRYKTLKEIANMWVVDVYHQKVHRGLGMPPAAMWATCVDQDEILVPDNPSELGFILGKSEKRILSHKGIELYGLFYNSPEMTALRRKLGEKFEVEIRIDTSNLGHIGVISPTKGELFKVRALHFDYANGLSEWQHRVCKRFAKKQSYAYSPEGWLEARMKIQELIDNEFMLKKRKKHSKIARYKNMDTAEHIAPKPTEEEPLKLSELEEEKLEPIDLPTPLTPDDIANDKIAPRARRISPILRDRTSASVAVEQPEQKENDHE